MHVDHIGTGGLDAHWGRHVQPDDELPRFLAAMGPLLRARSVHSAWLVGSRARGDAAPESDIDVILVAPSDRPFVERFRDYLPAILAASVGVDLLIYTPEEFDLMRTQEHPFLSHAMASARPIHVG